ncbi:FAD-binding and (Fe-S)-binding domain-containing protein [Psychroflexus salis]|uniref:Oxidoreductase n=1 Tax=Psychroflexus salis TaxID=1526574 RepID=A0A917E922_9FLAO|nr:FAD-binding and (Fe-S)-binding domain-containing protein [Psychroflexus salis]GGE11312.1 oxidoreductase [Psychroflexus salis]
MNTTYINWESLKNSLLGSLRLDHLHKSIYATDASVYRSLPIAVVFPKNTADLQTLVKFARLHNLSLIPRAAGTSLAGQCVGNGIVVDTSKHINKILHLDTNKKQIRVQPGVVLDELNAYLKPHNLFFSPNTSTANRCTIGGMFGNNSSGTTSIKYGVTRDKIIASKVVLADATKVGFSWISNEEWQTKINLNTHEGSIYRTFAEMKSNAELLNAIQENYPNPAIHRRNTGYALDEVLLFEENGININKLLAGSEGTLCFTTEVTLALDDLPPEHNHIIAAQFTSVEDALDAVQVAMKHDLFTCELMDKTILDCTKNQLYYKQHRFFIEADPKAILFLELKSNTKEDLNFQVEKLLKDLSLNSKAYATPILSGSDIDKAFELRKAGLGLLGNINSDKKAVACIEDTAVALEDLSNYIAEFTNIMKAFGQDAVYYAHAGAGELHLRPILNLKNDTDVLHFQQISEEVAKLVKKYNGSLSGEHGDGKVRSSFIKMMLGETCYSALEEVKNTFDPQGIFNPNKILKPLPIDQDLRYEVGRSEPKISTQLQFKDEGGILRAAEKCNGSGDCRKSHLAGGGMCPSYHVTKNEKDTTRARANALREFLTHGKKENNFNHKALKETFDLCVGCKACKNECPSNVDVTAFKTEFLHQYNQANPVSIRNWFFANIDQVNRFMKPFYGIYNYLISNTTGKRLLDKFWGIPYYRSLPKLASNSLFQLINRGKVNLKPNQKPIKNVFLFIDEFTNFYDVEIGKAAIQVLVKLNYEVKIIQHKSSGRALLSKGFLTRAKKIANQNINLFKTEISKQTPLLGIEPSAILSFKDEYIRLAEDTETAQKIAKHTFLIEEFLANEISLGNINKEQFTNQTNTLKVHVHCHQKALSSTLPTFQLLNFPENYDVKLIPSGCCGMAGSFGYEKEHYKISQDMANLQLLPAVLKVSKETIIVANGHSCRHQIKDATNRHPLHPIEVVCKALA